MDERAREAIAKLQALQAQADEIATQSEATDRQIQEKLHEEKPDDLGTAQLALLSQLGQRITLLEQHVNLIEQALVALAAVEPASEGGGSIPQ